MRKLHVMTLAAASAAFLAGSGAALAQTVSNGSYSYDQGADGAAAQKQNTLNAFQSGMAAGQTDQSATVATQSFNNGYQAGQAQASADTQNAYNNGYHDKAVEQTDFNNRAFDNGFRAGASEQAHLDDEFP